MVEIFQGVSREYLQIPSLKPIPDRIQDYPEIFFGSLNTTLGKGLDS